MSDNLNRVSASVDLEFNLHMLRECQRKEDWSQELARYVETLRTKDNLCLAEALVIAYVLNDGLVMCCNGNDDAWKLPANLHWLEDPVQTPLSPAAAGSEAVEVVMDSFEAELEQLVL